jgi:hypothetical protein
MTPKEKAKELVYKFKDDLYKQRGVTIYTEDAILCALIAVDEILNSINPFGQFLGKDYWQEVKQEIERL